jgi:hypothetical protein
MKRCERELTLNLDFENKRERKRERGREDGGYDPPGDPIHALFILI